MATKVKCQYCGKEKKTHGFDFFKCCGVAQSIEKNIVKPENHNLSKPESSGDNNQTKELENKSFENTKEAKEPTPKASSSESKTEKEEVETASPDSQKVDATFTEELKEKKDNQMEKPKEETLEIEEEEIEEESHINPEDYDYCCPDCKELFNEDGNKKELSNGEIVIVCPDCKAVLEE